jgi:ribonuclease-3
VIKSEGPDHNKIFWVEVLMGESSLGQGKGKSKQEAEQQAASAALEKYPQT